MKKFILLILSLLFITAFGFAQRTDLSGMTIVIDPGHGGYNTASDRQISIPGISVSGQRETYFWESLGNWKKANYLKPMLEALGANVILTREHNEYGIDPSNTSQSLPGLSSRSQVANDNNADWFHSIHSNALGNNTGTNYTMILLKEDIPTRQPAWPAAVGMGRLMGQYILKHNRTTSIANAAGGNWNSPAGVVLDYSFYSSYTTGYNLGVMVGANMSCELSEGSFHDYEPESRRLMNEGYLKNEAYALRNAMMEYWGLPADPLCIVAGIVTDRSVPQPVNYVNIRLEGSGISRTYTGDRFGNGYYFFDELPAGDYTLIFETEGYPTQSIPITLTPGELRFVDIPTTNTIPPTVTTPIIEGNTNTSVTANFDFTFSKVMDRASVQAAISFTPTVACNFTWSNNDMNLRVRPSMPLQSETNYTITIDGSAKDIVGIEIGESLVRHFTTLPASAERPVVIANYPISTTRNFPIIGTITIAFNKLMDTTSLKNAISLRRGSTNRERLLWFNTDDDKTIVTLKPVEPGEPNNIAHVVIISTAAKDITQNSMSSQSNIIFYTSYQTYKTPTVIESFANGLTGWFQPSGSGSTAGIDASKTTATADNTIYYPFTDNQTSMRLNYAFLPSTTNLIRQYLNSGPARDVVTDVAPSKRLQSFVFGDGSNNRVRFCLDDGPALGLHKVSNWVTIDWYGWRLIEWNFNDSAEIGSWIDAGPAVGPTVRFDSYQIQHDVNNDNNLEGTIWFDELRYVEVESTSSVPELLPENIPSEFSLEQNYPNPFNPSTNLQLNISETAKVKLVVYDILGREVSVLKDEIMNPGIYKVTWDATGMPSGTYFAKLYSGKNISTIKMLLAK
jgi:N-acetylmuramoyl-L-alanine amidase